MDLRLKFNEDVVNYETWRPTYVTELFHDIIQYSGLNESKRSLEIGIGTGQATLPMLHTGCHVTAVELGEQLAEFVKRKFAAFQNFTVMNSDFERFTSDDTTYDLIYAATAFHWIPQEIGFPKAYRLLTHGGSIALFWNHPQVLDPMHSELQTIYQRYKPFGDTSPKAFDETTCQQYAEMMRTYGFSQVMSKIYHHTRTLQAEEYVSLLNTYSDHRAIRNELKHILEREIVRVIETFGGRITIHDTIDLYLGKKLGLS